MAVSVTTGNDPADNPGAPLVCERCVIRPWRGYAKTSFVAYLADGSPVAESRGF